MPGLWDLTAKTLLHRHQLDQTEHRQVRTSREQSFEIGTTGVDLFNTSRFDTGAVAS